MPYADNPAPIYVAYAEDHKMVRETVIDFMEKLGGIKFILQAENGRELIAKIENSPIKPDVCLIDIVMPIMNGFETVTGIKKMWDNIKVLVLSGYFSEEYFIKMILSEADGYLTKKSNPVDIHKAIIDVHETGIYNTELFSRQFVNEVRNKRKLPPELTAKELQLLKLSIEDKTYEEIAAIMNLTAKSVEGHRIRLFQKLGVKTRAGLAMYAVKYGYVTIDHA
ncbi:MAG TPA: response regulator transcription factor [Flavipsychrobacter sp.]|nr:response regulator transcription factor [Flavipsychrobacter sp.]